MPITSRSLDARELDVSSATGVCVYLRAYIYIPLEPQSSLVYIATLPIIYFFFFFKNKETNIFLLYKGKEEKFCISVLIHEGILQLEKKGKKREIYIETRERGKERCRYKAAFIDRAAVCPRGRISYTPTQPLHGDYSHRARRPFYKLRTLCKSTNTSYPIGATRHSTCLALRSPYIYTIRARSTIQIQFNGSSDALFIGLHPPRHLVARYCFASRGDINIIPRAWKGAERVLYI